MRFTWLFVVLALNLAPGFGSEFAVASDGWQPSSKAARDTKSMRRKGMIPASMSCRNQPGTTSRLKPQTKIRWKKNTSGREWAAYIYKGHLDFMPGNQREIKNWRRIYKKRFRGGASGVIFNCSLWYRK